MKYKEGDKFIIEIDSVRNGVGTPYRLNSYSGVYFTEAGLEKFTPYKEPQPVTWRDGKKDAPDIGDEISYFYKGEPNVVYWATVCKGEDWTKVGVYWLPASEFPMPTEPKEQINPCPFCDEPCVTDKHTVHFTSSDKTNHWVECTCCQYKSCEFDTEQEAIAAHNAIRGQ